jgi:Arc/MetJ family transcription regulator
MLRTLEELMHEISETSAEIRRLRMLQSAGETDDAVLVLTIQELAARVDRLYEEKRAWHSNTTHLTRVRFAANPEARQAQATQHTNGEAATEMSASLFTREDDRTAEIAG